MLGPIAGILGAVVTGCLMAVLLRTVRSHAKQEGKRSVMEYGIAIRGLGIVMLIVGGFFLYAASRSSPDQQLIAWTVMGILAAGSLVVFLEVFLVRMEWDDSAIYSFSPWRRNRRIPWSEMVSCKYSSLNRWHIIKTQNQGTLRVSIYLSGSGEFLRQLPEKSVIKDSQARC